MEIKKDEISGLFYYEKLPENFRIATEKDFENIENVIEVMKPFLILGENWQVYQCYRATRNFSLKKIKYYLDNNLIFVLKNF